MKQLIFFRTITILLIFVSFFAGAQDYKTVSHASQSVAKYTYLVDVKGVATKQICLDIENKIGSKPDIISFKTVGFPSKYFVLKSKSAISQEQVADWLTDNNLTVAFFGTNESSLEALIVNKRKTTSK